MGPLPLAQVRHARSETTSAPLGVSTLSFTASDPNSSNLSVTATAALTVLDHAAAAFVGGGGTLNLSFGTLHNDGGLHAMQFQIENLAATYRAGLDLESIFGPANGVFSTDAMTFTDLAPGAESGDFDLFLKCVPARPVLRRVLVHPLRRNGLEWPCWGAKADAERDGRCGSRAFDACAAGRGGRGACRRCVAEARGGQ